MDSLWVRQAASPNLSFAGDIAVKTGPFFVGRIFNPRNLLSLHNDIAVVILKFPKGRFDSRSAAAPDFFPPSMRINPSLQSLLAKDLTQVLRAQAYNG